jgi:L-lactate permease
MKLAIKIIVAILFAAFAYILSSLVLGMLMGPGLLPQTLSAVIGIAALLLGLFGKPGKGPDNQFGGPGGPGPMNID